VEKTNCLITIITAVFNGEDYIKETIDSVLENAQDVDFEYIVINDGSTDKTREIIESYGSQVRLINKENSGESASLSLGFEKASGQFLLVVSADDPLFTPRIFQDVFNTFNSKKGIVAVYPDWRMIDQKGIVLKDVLVNDYSEKFLIGRCQTLPGPGTIFRAVTAREIGGRRSKWKFVGDYDFWLRLSRRGQIIHRSEILAQWRFHPNSTSINSRGPEMALERIKVVEEFLSQNSVPSKISRMALGNAYYMAARLVFFDSKVPGREFLFKAFYLRKGWIEEARIHVVAYIFLMPFSADVYQKLKNLKAYCRNQEH
jgi:glycosyltransferase involved in cell wall biosynthesis